MLGHLIKAYRKKNPIELKKAAEAVAATAAASVAKRIRLFLCSASRRLFPFVSRQAKRNSVQNKNHFFVTLCRARFFFLSFLLYVFYIGCYKNSNKSFKAKCIFRHLAKVFFFLFLFLALILSLCDSCMFGLCRFSRSSFSALKILKWLLSLLLRLEEG